MAGRGVPRSALAIIDLYNHPAVHDHLSADCFDALDAKRIGLLNEAVGTVEEMDGGVKNLCKLLKQTGPEAVAACKKLLHNIQSVNCDEARTITTKSIARARVSDEGQEGLQAFLEERPPNRIR